MKHPTLLTAAALLLGGCLHGDDGRNGTRTDTLGEVSERPASLPPFSSLGLYAPDSPLNTPIPDDATIDPRSADYIAKIDAIAQDPPPVLAYGQYSTTVFIADQDTPHHTVTLSCGEPWGMGVSSLRNVPIPDSAIPTRDTDGADNPIPPGGCGDQADQDNHMVILDLANRCEYDLWQARKENGLWVASWANAIPMDSSGIYPTGLSTRGSGFAFTGGLVWPDELQSGEIHHALVMSYPLTRSGGPVPPATESDGWSDDPAALPEGAHLRLDPTLDLDSLDLDPVEHALARAMQIYGIYLVDDGGGIQLYAVDPDSTATHPYSSDALDPREDYLPLHGIPWARLQVLTLPPQDPDFQAKLALPQNGCAKFD